MTPVWDFWKVEFGYPNGTFHGQEVLNLYLFVYWWVKAHLIYPFCFCILCHCAQFFFNFALLVYSNILKNGCQIKGVINKKQHSNLVRTLNLKNQIFIIIVTKNRDYIFFFCTLSCYWNLRFSTLFIVLYSTYCFQILLKKEFLQKKQCTFSNFQHSAKVRSEILLQP